MSKIPTDVKSPDRGLSPGMVELVWHFLKFQYTIQSIIHAWSALLNSIPCVWNIYENNKIKTPRNTIMKNETDERVNIANEKIMCQNVLFKSQFNQTYNLSID